MKSLRFFFLSFIACLATLSSQAQTGVPVPNMATADQEIQAFLTQWKLAGGSFAIVKDERLVYARGFGYATLDSAEMIQPHHQFRLASISKTFTSVGIMHLVEAGQLSLSDTIFGANGILSDSVYGPITDSRIYDITVRNLMDHSGGWDRDISGDVVFRYTSVANHFHIPLPVSDTSIIRFAMTLPLDFDPGTHYAYSNLGWMMLGRIIEEVSGIPYEQYIQQVVMEPVGAYNMQLGKSLREDKARQEVEYFDRPNAALVPSVLGFGTPAFVPSMYGGIDMKSAGSAGAWISSAKDLLRFLTSVDRLTGRPDQLHDTTIQMMIAPSANNAGYALGWGISGTAVWGHGGALPGTSTLYYRRANGISWAALINARDYSTNYYNELGNMMNRAATATTWPTHDLFQTPDQPTADISFSQITDTSITVSIMPGDGFGRALVVREGEPVYHVPSDGVSYPPNIVFGAGPDLGAGEYIVANGSPSMITVSGLLPGRTYHFEVFEWNQTVDGYPIYLTSRSLTGSEQTTGTNALEPVSDFVRLKIYPNPVSDLARIQLENNWRGELQVQVVNALGQGLLRKHFSKNNHHFNQTLELQHLPAGSYHLIVSNGSQVATQSFVKK